MTADLTPDQAMKRLGLTARSTFWREIWRGVKAGVIIAIKWGSTYRFDAASIEAWRAKHIISSVSDLQRATDGRSSFAQGASR